jgi:hypothetical protein
MRVSTQVRTTVLVVGLLLVGGCASAGGGQPGAAPPDASADAPTASPPADPGQPARPGPDVAPSFCAELPPAREARPGDLEGWFNATPARADGSVLQDPEQWGEPLMRLHPRVALVDVDTATVISTYDRVACASEIPGYVPPAPGPQWTAGSTVILDADTGEVLGVHAHP